MRREVLVALALAGLVVAVIIAMSENVTTAANETADLDFLSLTD